MPAKPPKAFDVWFVTANTVYKAVPYNVVADWTQQGRLAPTDMVRPSGTTETWVRVADHDLLRDYVPRPAAKATKSAPAPAAPAPTPGAPAPKPATKPSADGVVPAGEVAVVEDTKPVELPDPEVGAPPSRFEDDDEVDMIPLIDISMVLLVFFIMIQAAGALAPVDVPEMQYAGQLSNDPDAITISIEKLNTEKVYYSVRVGSAPPQKQHDQLETPAGAKSAVSDLLKNTTRPPEVRIACRKDLPRKLVYDMRNDLEEFRKMGMINNTVATVVDAGEK